MRSKRVRLLLAAIAALITTALELRPAHAIVGRPLTPLSYAGVARRTTRRAVAAAPAVRGAPIYW
jgi:hypothetical protein